MTYYLIIFILSILATYIVHIFALRSNIIDTPNERSSHTIPTPRGGGLAFVGLWFLGMTYEFYTNNVPQDLYFAMLAGLLLVGVSIVDDIKNVRASVRLAIQILASGIALYFLGGFQRIDLGFYVIENVYIITPIALIGFVWFINLFNFLDGIDGYVGLETVFIFLFIAIIFHDVYALLLSVAVAGFLVWNWQPAKIFMGDVGSTLIGFNVAVFMTYYSNTEQLSAFIFLILTSVFWFDATLTLLRRWRNKESLGIAHRKHAYQRLTQSGFSHQKTSILLLIVNSVLGVFAYAAYLYSSLIMLFFAASIILLFFVVKYIDKRKPF